MNLKYKKYVDDEGYSIGKKNMLCYVFIKYNWIYGEKRRSLLGLNFFWLKPSGIKIAI